MGRNTDQADRLTLLLDGAPATPLIIRPNGRVEVQPRLKSWLGLARLPQRLEDLSSQYAGMQPEDLAQLQEDIATARKTARCFKRSFVPQNGAKTLLAKGALAPSRIAGAKSVVVWIFAAPQSSAESSQLRQEVQNLNHDFAIISGLLEAAPFPMWHRGPDLRLARQYVEGHGGTLNLISELGFGTAVQIELPRT